MTGFFEELDKLYQSGDTGAVETFLHSALDKAERGSLEEASVLNELAGFYRGVSRFRESKDAFSRALDIFRDNGMESTREYATVLLNLAGLHRMSGDAEGAVPMFRQALGMLERGGYEYISALNNLALAYGELRDYGAALEYAQEAYGLVKAGGGEAHELAASLNNLAAIKLKTGELDDAGALISEALDIYGAMPEENVHHAAALATRGAVLCRIGDYPGALRDFTNALTLTARFFGKNIEYAVCLRNMAQVYELQGDIGEAASCREEAAAVEAGLR